MTPSACGSASGERLPWKSGSTCRRPARSCPPRRAARRCARRSRDAARRRLAAGAVPADDVVEQRAGRRLAALADPAAGQGRAEIRPPDAGKGARLGRQGHDAARRAGDQRQVAAMFRRVAGKAAEHAERAGIGVDEAGARPGSVVRPSVCGGLGGQRTEVGADRTGALRQAAALQHVVEPDARRRSRAASRLLMRQIGPFAGQRALRARESSRTPARSGSRRGRRDSRLRAQLSRQVPLQPHQLRRLPSPAT